MAHDYKLSVANANARASAHNTRMASGYLRIYSAGSGVPATADTALSDQVLLAELRYGSPAYGSPSNGVLTANAITGEDAALDTATAAFYRDFASDGTTVEGQGTVGTADADLILNTTSIVTGAPVSVTAKTHTVPLG